MGEIGGLQLAFLPETRTEDETFNLVVQALRKLIPTETDSEAVTDKPAFSSYWQQLKTILIKRDPRFMLAWRRVFQAGFDRLYEQLHQLDEPDKSNEQIFLFITDLLNLLPYGDLNPYEFIRIPQYIDAEWLQVEYKVRPIELTPNQGWESWLIQEQDRVFAYGLEPMNHPRAEPHLIFMGTTFPAGQGFWAQIVTDLQAFRTVGSWLFHSGCDKVLRWLEQQENKVHVTGLSLGGSLALQLAREAPGYLSRVDAQNPAGFYDSSYYNSMAESEANSLPRLVVQAQGSDLIARLGKMPPHCELIAVLPQKGHLLWDHPSIYTGLASTRYEQKNVLDYNHDNLRRSFWLYTVLRTGLYYGLVLPYHYLLRPGLFFVFRHFTSLMALAAATSLFALALSAFTLGFLPLLGPVAVLGISLLAVGVFLSILSYTGHQYFAALRKNAMELRSFSKIHQPDCLLMEGNHLYGEPGIRDEGVDKEYQRAAEGLGLSAPEIASVSGGRSKSEIHLRAQTLRFYSSPSLSRDPSHLQDLHKNYEEHQRGQRYFGKF